MQRTHTRLTALSALTLGLSLLGSACSFVLPDDGEEAQPYSPTPAPDPMRDLFRVDSLALEPVDGADLDGDGTIDNGLPTVLASLPEEAADQTQEALVARGVDEKRAAQLAMVLEATLQAGLNPAYMDAAVDFLLDTYRLNLVMDFKQTSPDALALSWFYAQPEAYLGIEVASAVPEVNLGTQQGPMPTAGNPSPTMMGDVSVNVVRVDLDGWDRCTASSSDYWWDFAWMADMFCTQLPAYSVLLQLPTYGNVTKVTNYSSYGLNDLTLAGAVQASDLSALIQDWIVRAMEATPEASTLTSPELETIMAAVDESLYVLSDVTVNGQPGISFAYSASAETAPVNFYN